MGRALGEFVGFRRTELSLTRREVAERSGLSYPYVSQIETGEREPSLKGLGRLAVALDVPVERLAGLLSGEDWTSDTSPLMSLTSSAPTSDQRRYDKLLMSLERRLRDVPPLERLVVLNELSTRAVQELQQEDPQA